MFESHHYSELFAELDIIEEALNNSRETIGDTVSIARNLFSIICMPVIVDTEGIGAVVALQESIQIQSLEQKIRKAHRHEGRTAKSTFADMVGDSLAGIGFVMVSHRLEHAFGGMDVEKTFIRPHIITATG